MATLSEIIFEVQELGVKSVRVDSDVRRWVNASQKKIAQRRNWTFMRQQQPFAITGAVVALTSNSAANPSVVVSATHGLATGQKYTGSIEDVATSYPTINGERTITVTGPTGFTVPVNVTTAGTGGTITFRSVGLGSTFKCLASEKSPVTYDDPTGTNPRPIPVDVISRAISNRIGYYNPSVNTVTNSYPIQYVFLELNGPTGEWGLYLPPQYQPVAITFNVSGYFYPADLSLGTDSNALTNHPMLEEALINMTKARAYFAEEVDNPKGTAALALAEQAIRSAQYSDAAQEFSGRPIRL
jgi:hypothetical protein